MADYTLSVKITGDADDLEKSAKSASSTFEKLGDKLKSLSSGFVMGAGMKAFDMAMGSITSHMDSAISRFDTLNNFPKVMENLGIDAGKAEDSIDLLKERLSGLPTTLDAAASGVQRLTATNGDVEKSTDYFLAMNDAIVAGGQSTEVQQSAMEQLSQAYSKGKMEMEEWRALQMAMPGQLSQIAQAMGMTADELGEGLRDGSISMNDFMDKIVELDTEGVNGLKSFQDQAADSTNGIGTALANLNTAITSGITNSMQAIDDALQGNNLPTIGEMINMVGGKISDLGKKVAGFIPTLVSMGMFVKEHSGTFKLLGGAVLGVVGAFKAMSMVNTVSSGIQALSANLLSLTGRAAASVPALGAEAAASTAAGNASRVSASGFMKAGAGLLMMGAGIALAAAGMALLVQSAIALATAGTPAVAILGGMVLAFTGLIAVMALVGPALTAGALGMIAFGAAILLASAGIALVVTALGAASSGISQILGAISGTIATAGAVIMGTLNSVRGIIAAFASSAIAVFRAFGSTISSVLSRVGGVVSSVLGSIGSLFDKFGKSVRTVLDGVSGVINSMGSSISRVLDSVSGIFTSMGRAALEAGIGVRQMAGGVKQLVDLKLGDLVATLGSTAKGIGKMAKAGKDIPQIASGMQTVVAGAKKMGNGLTSASRSIQTIGRKVSSFKSTAGSAFNGASNAISKFKTSASNSLSGVKTKLDDFVRATGKIKNIKGKVTIKAKVPHFSVSWSTHTKGKTSVSIPTVKQWATGAIFTGPSLLSGYNLVGEAGPEAVAPISTLQRYVTAAVDSGLRGQALDSSINIYMNYNASDDAKDMARDIMREVKRYRMAGAF